MNTSSEWYHINNIDVIDSPALVIYKDRVIQNIKTAVSMVDDVKRLRPHVKTHKSKEPAQLMMNAGINKFKCATIAEAEMLAMIKALDVLLAYQPVGPKLVRFIQLIKKYPETKFSCLIDNIHSAKSIADAATGNSIEIKVFIDLDVGMNRTGIVPGIQAIDLYSKCKNLPGIEPIGLHAYDGHIRTIDLGKRTIECDAAFKAVTEIQLKLEQQRFSKPIIIAGGSPTFPVHAKRKNVECSPGTFVYWDKTYLQYTEQHFVPAALVISRIISLPTNKLCLDLGHKSISAENELNNRVSFLNAPGLKFTGHSEEHLVAEAPEGHAYKAGDILFGLPVHICPTCALYERAYVVEDKSVTTEWKMIARDRKITV
jgi:D-serine deaminase-like pyridoxal phosphate-dependent protein